ncbi:MAG: MerR family transcriptional regulator [Chloroflexi bacterium]|nr:MerR family transcriptional regulator [Chloroflexota bacterium]
MASSAVYAAMLDGLRPISVVAHEVGLTPRTIRYYEELGLIHPVARGKGADRLFDDNDVRRLREIKYLREVLGFSFTEITELLNADEARLRLQQQLGQTANPRERVQLLRMLLGLRERRHALIERKLARIEAACRTEREQIALLQTMLAEEEHRAEASSGA